MFLNVFNDAKEFLMAKFCIDIIKVRCLICLNIWHSFFHTATAVRQLSNGTNGDDLYIRIATVGNTIQTVNSPMYDTHMSTPGNTAKLGATHSNIQTAQRGPSLVGS